MSADKSFSSLDPLTSSSNLLHEPEQNQIPDGHPFITLYCGGCGTSHKVLLSCGDKTCIFCRKRIYGMLMQRLWKTLETTTSIRFMTLTFKNISYITEADILRLRNSWRKLYNLKAIRSRIRGGVYVIEVTNIGNGWHIHLHIIYDGDFIPQAYLSNQWRRITGDSFIVDISRVKSRSDIIRYLAKYLIKAPEIKEHKAILNIILKHVKILSCFGYWYKLKPPKRKHLCPICGCSNWMTEWEVYGTSGYIDWEESDADPPQERRSELLYVDGKFAPEMSEMRLFPLSVESLRSIR